MLSFWEKNSFINCEYIVIGSGILGLSTACSIKERNSSSSVLILERGIFPTGASTKNAGFACFGSLTELLSNFNSIGENETISLIENRSKGIGLLRQRLGDNKIGFKNYGGYELLTDEQIRALDKIDFINDKLLNIFKINIFEIKNNKIKEFGFNEKIVKALVYSSFESQIDTGKMMCSLIDYAASLGIRIINGCDVKSLNEKENFVEVAVKNSIAQESVNFYAKKVILCTNAFSTDLFLDSHISPARGQVLVTKPIEGLKIKGVFHYDEGYYYFRDYDERVIFGGGRNLDFEKEKTHEFELNKTIINDLKNKLDTIILPNQEYEVDCCWTGIMGFNDKRIPEIKKISDRTIMAISCNGMGVALSSYVGKEVLNYV